MSKQSSMKTTHVHSALPWRVRRLIGRTIQRGFDSRPAKNQPTPSIGGIASGSSNNTRSIWSDSPLPRAMWWLSKVEEIKTGKLAGKIFCMQLPPLPDLVEM